MKPIFHEKISQAIYGCKSWDEFSRRLACAGIDVKFYNTAAKSNRFGTQDKPNKNVIRTWATTQEKSIQRISRPK